MKTPPFFLLTRFLLPLGLPLVTLPMMDLEVAPVARHVLFFGFCGVAMGLTLDREHAKRFRFLARKSTVDKKQAAESLRTMASKEIEDPEQLAIVETVLEKWSNSDD